jgi:peptidoglycan-associated lipoprotein
MLKQRLSGILALMLVGVVLAGCSSSSTEEPVTPPAPEPVQEPAPAPQPPPEPPSDFDDQGNPLDPSTRRPLSRTFYFDYDRAVLKPADLAALEIHAKLLRSNSDRSVVLEGHCDERGTREYNLALGERRADSVRSFLISSGVSARQIETVSYGEERPQDPGSGESAWSRNRRAVMIYR